jgi:hypothetical protein
MNGIADLHIGPLGLGALVELFAGHGRAVDAVAPRLGADIDHRIADAGGLAVEDLVDFDQAERKGIDQRIAAVAGLKFGFAAQVGHAKAVAVAGDAAHHALDDGVILVDQLRRFASLLDRPEAQRIHHRQRPRAHGEDVAQDSAYSGGRALMGLDVAGMIVALDLEGAGPSIAHVDDAGVFARSLHNTLALGGQALQMHARGLVGAVLAPHDASRCRVRSANGVRPSAPRMRWYSSAVMLCCASSLAFLPSCGIITRYA